MKNKIINPNLNSENVLSCQDLKIIFGKNKKSVTLIENFSHSFKKGKIYFIIGNSGVGKTTLISHFNGILKSKYGNIFINDQAILFNKKKIKNYKKIRKNISLLFQFPEYQLFKDTVIKDITFGPLNLGYDKQTAESWANKYIKLMGIKEEYLDYSPFELSGGEMRKVAIAGILAINSQIIVFDEPTAGLDPLGERQIFKIITDLKKEGKTIIIVSHNMDNVLEFGDEVILISDKLIKKIGKPYDIFLNDDTLNNTNIGKPKIISTIDFLSKQNKKYNRLYDLKPTNVEQLAKDIGMILNENGGCND